MRCIAPARDGADELMWNVAELDEEVGAFVRAIQEAPLSLTRGGVPSALAQAGPTPPPSRLTLQAGLDQLARFKARVEAS